MASSSTSTAAGAREAGGPPDAGHAALARLAERALTTRDTSGFVEQVAAEAARILGADCSCILELSPDRDALLMRAGAGWPAHGRLSAIPAGEGSLAAAAFAGDPAAPLVIGDLDTESRFAVPPLWRERELSSGVIAPIPATDGPYGLLGVLTTGERTYSREDLDRLRALAAVLGLGLARAAADEERDDVLAREQAVRAQADVLAVERERSRLAGELHDRLSQVLFSLALKLDWCLAQVGRGSEIALELGQIRDETGAMMEAIRGVVAELSGESGPAPTSAERLRRLVQQFQALTGVAAELTLTGEPARLDRRREDVLQRTFQEALANVTKHARARSVAIRLDIGDDRVSFEVADDGVGFPAGMDAAALIASDGHFGLRQMVHRIESLGGRVRLAPNTPGARLYGEVPIGEAGA